MWTTGPKERVRGTNLPFITTGRCQGSLGQVPDSGTKVLHHRVRLVVHSPAWLLGSVHLGAEQRVAVLVKGTPPGPLLEGLLTAQRVEDQLKGGGEVDKLALHHYREVSSLHLSSPRLRD